jgi:hypothetical protein
MKNLAVPWTTVLLVFGLCGTTAAQSQSLSLGDYGRGLRNDKLQDSKRLRKVYDNDNLPSTDQVSVVGSAPEGIADADKPANDKAENTAGSTSDARDNSNLKKKESVEITLGQSPQERQEAYTYWKKRIDEQREKVDRLARELDDLKQNAPMSVAVFHLWPDDQLYLQTIAEKQKVLDRARADLSDLQDKARRAGVPSSFREGDDSARQGESQEDRRKAHANVILQQQARKTGVSSPGPGDDKNGKDVAENADGSDSRTNDKVGHDQKDPGEIKLGQSPQERQKAYSCWKTRVEDRGEKIDQLTRELDVLKKNVPTAVILHLWPEDQIYLQMVADKEKALEQAKADLSDLQEQARKTGVPSSFR